MPKLHQVTIPHSAFAELRHFLAERDTPSPPKLWLTLATLLTPMIGHIRLFETKKDEPPNILEWSSDAETGPIDLRSAPAILAAEFGQVRETFEKLSSPRSVGDIDLFLDLSLNPSDKSLSIDVTTEPVLGGQDLSTLLATSTSPIPMPTEGSDVPIDDIYLTAAKTAELLHVDKSTVTRRIKHNELIGFRIFKNAFRIPRDQFKDGDVIDGIKKVLSFFKSVSADGKTIVDHRAAWTFLSSTIYPGGVNPRPVDRLRAASSDYSTSLVLKDLALAKQSFDYGDHI